MIQGCLLRASAAPGVGLCLIGGVAETLEKAAEDCRRRGAQVETLFWPDGRAGSSFLAGYLAALDRRAPIDALVVVHRRGSASQDLVDTMGSFAAVAEPMRRRGLGEIVLVSSLVGQAAVADARAILHLTKAFLAYGAALRRKLRTDGIAVVVVAPGSIAIRAAARFRAPQLTMVSADRLAEQIGRARRRAVGIAVPGPVAAAMKALRVVFSRVLESTHDLLLPTVDSIRDPADEAHLHGKDKSYPP